MARVVVVILVVILVAIVVVIVVVILVAIAVVIAAVIVVHSFQSIVQQLCEATQQIHRINCDMR